MTPTLIKAYSAAATIRPNRAVAFAGTSSAIAEASGPTDPLIGIAYETGTDGPGMCDLVLSGIASAKLGGTVDAGDRLTADAQGRLVAAAPGAAATHAILAIALDEGVEDDIIDVLLERSFV